MFKEPYAGFKSFVVVRRHVDVTQSVLDAHGADVTGSVCVDARHQEQRAQLEAQRDAGAQLALAEAATECDVITPV